MSNVFEAPLRLELTTSRHRSLWLIGIHALVVSTLPLLPSACVQLLVFALVLASLAWELRRHNHNVDHTRVLLWRSDGLWEIGSGASRQIALLSGPAFVHPWLVVLRVRTPGQRMGRHIVIFADSLHTAGFRRLRVRLRFQADSHQRATSNLSHPQL